ncbi:hypothetical protein [Streptomyces venezuelae]|uniref:hypothetical protein n=1 Tax=Streptomyces venezuelae TaxID=54571 RepID=UPI00123AE771|nr:hypothetical protein [Streptomyces venezuelae]
MSLLLVPALLTALVGPLLPAGTALAATPSTPSASAAPPPDPDPTTDPTASAPEPSATTDPTAPPEPPAEPSPNPTGPSAEPTPSTEPTADPCPALPLAPLGDPGDAVRHVTMEPNSTACFTFTAVKPGPHQVLLTGGLPGLKLSSSGGSPVACPDLGMSPCELAAGTYTLDIATAGYTLRDTRLAVVPLMAGPGCPDPVGTDFGTAPTTGTADEAGVVCHSFTAAPGELVTSKLQLQPGLPANVTAWITDDTGKWLCNVGQDCVLPDGTGGYRVLAHLDPSAGAYPVPYTLKVRQVSHPVGCAAAGVNVYGTAPTPVSPPTECRTFTPATTGGYSVETIQPTGLTERVPVYAPNGRICEYMNACQLVAGVTYTLVTDAMVRILDRTSADGCENVSLGQPHRGGLTAPGEADCVNLPVPQGAQVAVLTAPVDGGITPDVTILDATGASLCWTRETLSSGTCVLDGTAPYRALLTRGWWVPTIGGYDLVVRRTDVASDCRTFPAGDFSADPAMAPVRAGTFDCLTIAADDHSARELITRGPGSPAADFTVLDENGVVACRDEMEQPREDCALTPGLSYTILLPADWWHDGTLVRRDVTATARGCVETPATKAGAPSLDGIPAGDDTFVCHRVTTADARDTLHLNARYLAGRTASAHGVYGASGEDACEDMGSGCAVTGSTAYQAVVHVGGGDTTPAYRFDALRIGTAAGPAPECVRITDITYGFGPLTGTLSEQQASLCAVLPTESNDWLKLFFAPARDLRISPVPWLYDGETPRDVCSPVHSSGYYSCEVPGEDRYEHVPRPTTLVIGLPSVPPQGPVEVSASASCPLTCGSVTRAVTAVGPGTVGAGKITMTVTGAALHEKDAVELSGGAYRARSTTVSVAPDRRSMVVALDLTGAPRTALSVNVVTHDGDTYARGRVTVVAPLRAAVAPSVTGTAVIGGKVTAAAGSWTPAADAYAYQWRADGVAIAGATASTYTIPAALQGRQLSLAVTARKAGHPTLTAVSGAVLVKGLAPKPAKAPSVSGAVRVGDKVTVLVGTWSPSPTSYAYQWRADGVAIAGATGPSYVPVGSVRGRKLTVTVTAHRTGHLSGAYTTGGYTVGYGLAPKATRAPYVTGTVKVGRTLSLNRGTWTPAPTSYAYQWYVNGRAVSGATKSWFTLSQAHRGTKLIVRVTAYRTGHLTGVAWTRTTGAVAG